MFKKLGSIFKEKDKVADLAKKEPQFNEEQDSFQKAGSGKPRKSAKKKRLPADFGELLEKGDFNALKAVFDVCDINARSSYMKSTALMCVPMSKQFFNWLLENGADLHALDESGGTLLHHRAGSYQSIDDVLNIGLDINQRDDKGNTPLHYAARSCKADNLDLLVKNGANIQITNNAGQTALEMALVYCSNYDLEYSLPKIANILIDAGSAITPRMRQRITEIAEKFEFHRSGYNAETVDLAVAGLDRLYKLFDVPRVPQRILHDGKSLIRVKATHWSEQHEELWQLLVPSSGPAATMQGEVVRIAGRIARELDGNGGINWGTDFKRMADCFYEFIQLGEPLSDTLKIETKELVEQIKKKQGEPERLFQLSVLWVLQNPEPIKLPRLPYGI